MSKTLIIFWLALALAPAAGAIATPAAPQSGASEGAKVNLTFANLDPGKTYSIVIPDPSQFEFTPWKSGTAPADLELSSTLIRFKGPQRTSTTSKYTSASFAVGALMSARSLTWKVRLEEPAVLFVDSPALGIFQLITGAPSQAETEAELATTKNVPTGCMVGPTCSPVRGCPLVRDRVLHCYGPLLETYWCCWEDPFP